MPENILNHVEIVMGDVRDANQMRVEIKKMDYVLHLSALIAIPYSYNSPKSISIPMSREH